MYTIPLNCDLKSARKTRNKSAAAIQAAKLRASLGSGTEQFSLSATSCGSSSEEMLRFLVFDSDSGAYANRNSC